MQCLDYDLCASCEYNGHHSHHIMLRISKTDVPLDKCTKKIMGHINRSIKKANHVAHKEACRTSKYLYDSLEKHNYGKKYKECPKSTPPQNNDSQENENESTFNYPMENINLVLLPIM